ncbi:MAG: CDGSH iron-sulfur domain-containing protein [Phycisphaeraceae bacterium]|nr:CDGSH iron-sulfur domain-containing protein [Phycisphaeraceae bacterium]
MPRLIRHDATAPFEVKPTEKSVWICLCGLSRNYPLCDGSHKTCRQVEQPGKLHVYDKDRQKVIEIRDDL